MLSLALLAVTLAVQPGPSQAPAPPPAARAEAYQAFLEARRLEAAGDAPGAIAALEKAATLDASPGILTELAQLYARHDRSEDARKAAARPWRSIPTTPTRTGCSACSACPPR